MAEGDPTTAAPVIKGVSDSMTRVSHGYKYTLKTGEQYIEIWEGPLANDVAQDFYQDKKDDESWDEIDISKSGGTGTVTLTRYDADSGAGPVDLDRNAIWTADMQEIQRDIRTHKYFDVSGIVSYQMTQIDKAIEHGEPIGTASMTENKRMMKYLGMRRAGYQTYPVCMLIITKSIVTSSRSIIRASYEHINRIVPLNDINGESGTIAGINPPDAIIQDLTKMAYVGANGYASHDPHTSLEHDILGDKLAGETTGTPATESLVEWEWIKKPPTCQSSNGKKFEIKYTWWGLTRWSAVLYGGSEDPEATT